MVLRTGALSLSFFVQLATALFDEMMCKGMHQVHCPRTLAYYFYRAELCPSSDMFYAEVRGADLLLLC